MSWPRFSVRRPVTTWMIYLGVLLLGLIAWSRLPRELFPPITYPQLTVITHYKDAAPEEIELLVTKPIEEVTGTVAGLRRINSISKEEISLVIAEFNWDTNMDFAGLGIREKIDLIKERLPRGAEDPVVIKYNPFELPVLVLNLSGELPSHELLNIARKQAKNELEKVEGVAAVNLSGGREREILVEVDQGRLQAAALPISHVVDSLSRANLNYPAGTIKEAFYEYLIRTMGEFSVVKEIPGIAVGVDEQKEEPEKEFEKQQRESRGGPLEREKGLAPRQRLILLKDIAAVKDTLRDRDSISRFNGKDNVSLSIQKQAGANTLQLAKKVKETVGKIQLALPPGVTLQVAYDQSLAIEDAVRGVRDAAVQGGLLAFLVLFLFLGSPGAALNVTFAIPISVVATLALMYFSGTTVNIISMGGLALGVGMLVDAGIVVVENIARLRETGLAPAQAAVKGTEEVASAIGGSILTTIVVFLPMVFVVGIAGQLFKELAFTVTWSLLASWAVSLTLTCLVASRLRGGPARSLVDPWIGGLQEVTELLVRGFFRNRMTGLVIMAVLLYDSVSLITTLDRETLPRVDQGQFILRVNLEPGTKLEVTDRIARRIEEVLRALPEVRDATVNIGSSKEKRAEELLETLGSHQAQILVNLLPRHRGWGAAPSSGTRKRKTSEVVQELKTTLERESLEGANIDYVLQDSVFKSAFLAGAPVVVEVKGTDLARLEKLANEVRKDLAAMPGFYGVQTSLVPPSPETKVRVLKDRAATYHLSVSDIALTAQTAVKGFVATKFKEEGKEIDIRVRLRKQDREDFGRVRRLLVHSPLDIDVPLAEVATLSVGTGPTEIRRLDQQRTVLVSAQLFGRSLGQALEEVSITLARKKLPSGYSIALTGERQQMEESFRSLAFALGLSVLLVYMVMAAEFESLWQPFLIMATIPMAMIGVGGALWMTQTPISVMVALGFIVLGGVVVNNGIVLIEFVNQLRRQGLSPEEAVVRASRARLRPILMTAGTTVLGLLPLALGLQAGVELQAPMAITVMGGLTVSTFLTLIFLPTLYLMGANFFERLPRIFPRPQWEPAVAAEGPAADVISSRVAARDLEISRPGGLEMTVTPELPAAPPPISQLSEELRRVQPELPEIPEEFGGEEAVPERDITGLFPGSFRPKPEEISEEGTEQAPPSQPPFEAQPEGPHETVGEEPTEPPEEEEPPPAAAAPAAALAPEPILPPSLPSIGPPSLPPISPSVPSSGPAGQAPEPPLNPRQQKLMGHLRAHGRITRKGYADLTGASVPTAARDLKELVDRGLIKGVGPLAKGRYYVLA